MENSFRVVEFQFEGHTCNEGERLGMIVDQLCNFSLDGVFEHFLVFSFKLLSTSLSTSARHMYFTAGVFLTAALCVL